ncbi:ribonuclease P protein component [Sphingobacterium sp. BIGb0165]|uniref:ribonuclease P protein component n=1 Tax=Sphingobacterium sp. BIGb0165 TaxID=2940615 RepID=UPI00216A5870|nr:ribonuclease P protein component [Sphingobacterium sp. BIGb0165]MCS4228723.1 ribonuclease P protein component [Sphingobacterium sp. BIGb0165]
MRNTFTKEERLCAKRRIDALFKSGSSFVLYPFRIVFVFEKNNETENIPPCQSIISVSKRRFKRAVDRNAIKRMMREGYRLQKSNDLIPFLLKHNVTLYLAIQYVGKQILAYDVFHTAMNKMLKKLQDECADAYLEKGN